MLTACLLAAVAAPSSYAPGLYEGRVLIPTGTVTVALTLRGPPADGTIDIPEQGLFRYPLSEFTTDGAAVRFSLPGLPGAPRFALSYRASRFEGIFSQGGQTFRAELAAVPSAQRIERALRGVRPDLQAALSADGSPGLAYGIVVDGERVTGALGVQRISSETPMTPETPFLLGAVTRTFVAVTAALRMEAGALSWDAPIADLLPAFRLDRPGGGLDATVGDLLRDAIAFAPHDVARRALADRAAAPLLRHIGGLPLAPLGAPRGADWSVAILGQLLAQPPGSAEGTRAVVDTLLSPFALPFSFEPPASRAAGHVRRNGSLTPVTAAPPFAVSRGLFGSAAGLALWLQVHVDRAVLEADSWRRLLSAKAGGWADEPRRGARLLRTGTDQDGVSIEILWAPADRVGVVAVANREGSALPRLVAEHLLDRVLGLAPSNELVPAVAAAAQRTRRSPGALPPRVQRTRPAHRLEAYAGRYEHPGYGLLTVRTEGNALRVRLGPLEGALTHWHYETFATAEDGDLPRVPWLFITDVRGDVVALTARLEPAVPAIRFERSSR